MIRATSFNPANAGAINATSVRSAGFSVGAANGVNTTIAIPAVATFVVTAGIVTSSIP